MSTCEFKVGEFDYSADRMDAFTQLHIGRRLSPLLSYVTAEGGKFIAIVGALSSASQADVDFIIKSALKVVKRKSGQGWANVYSATADQLAFQDINGIELLQIVAHAIEGDIAPFFAGLVKLAFDTDPLTSILSTTQTTTS